jgi:hypothetical protein
VQASQFLQSHVSSHLLHRKRSWLSFRFRFSLSSFELPRNPLSSLCPSTIIDSTLSRNCAAQTTVTKMEQLWEQEKRNGLEADKVEFYVEESNAYQTSNGNFAANEGFRTYKGGVRARFEITSEESEPLSFPLLDLWTDVRSSLQANSYVRKLLASSCLKVLTLSAAFVTLLCTLAGALFGL